MTPRALAFASNARRVVAILCCVLGVSSPARADCLERVHGRQGTWCSADGQHVRVWWRQAGPPRASVVGQPAEDAPVARDERLARQIRDEVERRVWSAFEDVMGRVPLPDGDRRYRDNGGDGRYDIMLVSDLEAEQRGTTLEVRRFSRSAPRARVSLVQRSLPDYQLLPTAARELMRGFLSAFTCGGSSCRWLEDATAAWAEHLAFPALNNEHGYSDDFFRQPSRSLFTTNPTANDRHPLGAYVFLLFLQLRDGSTGGDPSIVRRIWESAETAPHSVAALDAAIPNGLASVWRDFIRNNWNAHPLGSYRNWDGLDRGVSRWTAKPTLDIYHTPLGLTIPIAVDLPPLSAAYFVFEFDATVRRIEFTHNTQALGAAGGELVVLTRQGDDWTEHPAWGTANVREFCRDLPDQRIDEMVIILGNPDLTRSKTFVAGTVKPGLRVTLDSCLPDPDDGFQECLWQVPLQHRDQTSYQHSHRETWRITNREAQSPAGNVYYSYDWRAEGGGSSRTPNSRGSWSFSVGGSGRLGVRLEPPDEQSAARIEAAPDVSITVTQQSTTGTSTADQIFGEWARPKRTAPDSVRIEGVERQTASRGIGVNQVGSGTLTCRWSWPRFAVNPPPASERN